MQESDASDDAYYGDRFADDEFGAFVVPQPGPEREIPIAFMFGVLASALVMPLVLFAIWIGHLCLDGPCPTGGTRDPEIVYTILASVAVTVLLLFSTKPSFASRPVAVTLGLMISQWPVLLVLADVTFDAIA